MNYAYLLIAAVLSSGVSVGLLFFVVSREKGGIARNIGNLKDEFDQKAAAKEKIDGFFTQMIDVGSLQELAGELNGLEESLRAERGRITITQAEIETVETRLRELEEIERELEASGLETKEELNILQKKEASLKKNNEDLRAKITEATERIQKLLDEVELSSQAQEQITAMQTE